MLCNVRRRAYLYLVKTVQGQRYLIGDNCGGTSGWVQGGGDRGADGESVDGVAGGGGEPGARLG